MDSLRADRRRIWGGRVGLRTNGATTLVLIGCACFGLLAQGVQGAEGASGAEPSAQQCPTTAGVTSCSCAAASDHAVRGPAVKELKATLSEGSPKLNLTCAGAQMSGVPTTMENGDVCPPKPEGSLCDGPCEAGQAVKLDTLLGTTTASVKWVKENTSGENQKYSLTVPKDAFPLLDNEFAVGCKNNNNAVCKVSVALEARKSTTAGQTVTCAYGSASNGDRQSVTLTPSNNTLTVTCDKEGKIVPTENLTNFCTYGEDPTGPNCNAQAFTELFPGSDQSWWSTKEVNQAILTIPADKFPVEERKFALGCKYTPPTPEEEKQRTARSSPTPSVCSVDVIVAKQSPTTTTTSPTSSAFSSVCVSRTSVNVVVGLLSLGALQAVSLLG